MNALGVADEFVSDDMVFDLVSGWTDNLILEDFTGDQIGITGILDHMLVPVFEVPLALWVGLKDTSPEYAHVTPCDECHSIPAVTSDVPAITANFSESLEKS